VTAASVLAGADVLRTVTLMTLVERPSNRNRIVFCNHRVVCSLPVQWVGWLLHSTLQQIRY